MFLMSSADFKHRGISQEEFPRVFDPAKCPGLGFLTLSLAPVFSRKNPQNLPNPPNYFLCDKYNKWEVVV
jgi:hypothetical protein